MVDAEAAALKAVEIAAREIERLGNKDEINGFEGMDLERYARICLAYDHHRLTWMSKLQPEKLPDELLGRVKKELAQVGKPAPARRLAAAG